MLNFIPTKEQRLRKEAEKIAAGHAQDCDRLIKRIAAQKASHAAHKETQVKLKQTRHLQMQWERKAGLWN